MRARLGRRPVAPRVAALLPVLDEADTLPGVLAEIPAGVRRVVCDNGSTDGSAAIAQAAGAEVVSWPRRGYGGAVAAGLRHLATDPPDLVVIWDADGSVDPADLAALLAPLSSGTADLVLGDRTARAAPGALSPQHRWGNRWAAALLRLRTGARTRDFGPFREARYAPLLALGLVDPDYGWNVEMHLKALRAGWRIVEVPVHWRVRSAGASKVGGTVRGTFRAGRKITAAFWRYRAAR